jgi:fused signal recognition particle receptor
MSVQRLQIPLLSLSAELVGLIQVIGVTGFVLTKLDGTARGGCVVSVVDELSIPVKFVGIGEGLNDLQPFDAEAFVDALFP